MRCTWCERHRHDLTTNTATTTRGSGIENSKALHASTTSLSGSSTYGTHRGTQSIYVVIFSGKQPTNMGLLQAHISQHIALMAREIEAKNAQVIQEQAMKFGGQIPPELAQQFQQQMNEILKESLKLPMKW